jgi:signal transduction histidine kinase
MSTPSAESDPGGQRTVVRRALVRFAAAGALALVVVGGATVVIAHAISKDVIVREAQARGKTFAEVVSAPLIDEDVRAGNGEHLDVFSQVMWDRLEDKSMVHIKVWDRNGRVIWADEPGLQGRVFPVDPAVARLSRTAGVLASMSDLHKPDNVLDSRDGPLLEVYASTLSADGVPIIVETYWSADQLDDGTHAILRRLAPLSIGALVLFAAVVLPLASSLARRVDRAQAESKRSLQQALSASDLERRRIARDLHDGVLQEVSGAGYALSAARRTLAPEADAAHRLIEEASSALGSVGQSLRSLLSDIYPPSLTRCGLSAAVEELAGRAGTDGVVVEVDIATQGLDRVSIEAVRLAYRVIREALRNVVGHARATRATVTVTVEEGAIAITVVDDGVGLPPRAPEGEHLGLRLLEDTLVDLGGTLSVESGPGGGTTLSGTVPVQVRLR